MADSQSKRARTSARNKPHPKNKTQKKTSVDAIERLRDYLKRQSTGPIRDAKVEPLLAHCWKELISASEDSMEAYKLGRGRMDNVLWKPPCLRFEIERFGAILGGAIYAQVQHWTVDLEARTASLDR